MRTPPARSFVATSYSGHRTDEGTIVLRHRSARTEPLHWRLDLWNHSPTGLEWGYRGSGPSQLALALLADALDDDDLACALYMRFKFDVTARLPSHGWALTHAEIWDWVEAYDDDRLAAELDRRAGLGDPDDDDEDDDDAEDDAEDDDDEDLLDVIDEDGNAVHWSVHGSFARYVVSRHPGWRIDKAAVPEGEPDLVPDPPRPAAPGDAVD